MNKGFCVYAKESAAAVEFYLRAFNATLGYNVPFEEGGYYHAEIMVDGDCILAVSGNDDWGVRKDGRTMQFCLNFDNNRAALEHTYSVLCEDAEEVLYPIGKCDWNDCMADVVDKFGVRWYIAL